MNSANVSGRLTRDPEVIETKSEWRIIKFSIANDDESRKQADGSYEKVTSFLECEYLTKKPQYWLNVLVKGAMVAVSGAMRQDRWEKDGQKHNKIKIALTGFPVVFAPAKQKEEGGVPDDGFEDDIPF